jgi:4-hydroxy-tetrahydrodipicolinate synthase
MLKLPHVVSVWVGEAGMLPLIISYCCVCRKKNLTPLCVLATVESIIVCTQRLPLSLELTPCKDCVLMMPTIDPMAHCPTHHWPEIVTAAITPFDSSGDTVDRDAFSRLVALLCEQGSDGILVHGTTGEGPTLTIQEKIMLNQLALPIVQTQGKHLMTGISGNATLQTCHEVEALLEHVRPDSFLVVVPYYNKPTQEGMLAHFAAVARVAQGVPLVIYNIPGRTGVCMAPKTMQKLHDLLGSQLLGVKQSHADMEAVTEIKRLLPPHFLIWSGDDALTLPMLALGGHGVISVASHVIGRELKDMVQAFKAGEHEAAQAIHLACYALMRDLFQTTNPILIKALMKELRYIPSHSMRLPMLSLEPHQQSMIEQLKGHLQKIQPFAFV